MKKYTRYSVLAAMCFSLLPLCSCNYESKVVGTWQGDGSLDILGVEAPYEFAAQWVFYEDGTAIATVGEDNHVSFQYSMTDDTLTLTALTGKEGSWGVPYEVKGNLFRMETGNGFAEFTRAK